MIGKLETVVLDTRDPQGLAAFYAELLGGKTVVDNENWVSVVDGEGRKLSFQTSPDHQPPHFPDLAGSQQSYLDVRVEDVDEAEGKVLELGATRVSDAHEDNTFPRPRSGWPSLLSGLGLISA